MDAYILEYDSLRNESGKNRLYNIIFCVELELGYLSLLGVDVQNMGFDKFWLTGEYLEEYCKDTIKRNRILRCKDITLDLGQVSETEKVQVHLSSKSILNKYSVCSIDDSDYSLEYKKVQSVKNKYLLSGYESKLISIGSKIIEIVQGDRLNMTKYHSGVICDKHNHTRYSKNYIHGNLKFIRGIYFHSERKKDSSLADLSGIENIKSSIINQDKECQCIDFGELYGISACSLYGGWYNIRYIHKLSLTCMEKSVLRVEAADTLVMGTCSKSIIEVGEVFYGFDIEYAENVIVILPSDLNEKTFRLLRHSLSMMDYESTIIVKDVGKNKLFNSIFLELARSCRKQKIYVVDYWGGHFHSFDNLVTYKEWDFESVIRYEVSLWN